MITIEVITPTKVVYATTGTEVTIPTTTGIIGIRQGHLPLVAPLQAGEVVIHYDAGQPEEYLAIAGGFVEVLPDRVHILADLAERSQELNETEISEAIAAARIAHQQALQNPASLEQASFQLQANLARQKVVRRRKHTLGMEPHLHNPEAQKPPL